MSSGKGKGQTQLTARNRPAVAIDDWTCRAADHIAEGKECCWDRDQTHLVYDVNGARAQFQFSPETQQWYKQTSSFRLAWVSQKKSKRQAHRVPLRARSRSTTRRSTRGLATDYGERGHFSQSCPHPREQERKKISKLAHLLKAVIEYIRAAKASMWQSYCIIFETESDHSRLICEIVDKAWLRIAFHRLPTF